MPEVILPNKEVVDIPLVIDPNIWFVNEMSGYVNPRLLAPYPDQPRKYMDPAKLEELESSVARIGVREQILVTPTSMAPWSNLEEGDTRPFLVVSGHRRHSTSVKVDLSAVPIKVRIYKNKAAFDMDATTLNEHRVNLSEIEEGWIYRDRVNQGEKLTHIRDETGKAFQWLQGRINLTYLCPSIQELISPKLRRRQRLATGFAGLLGELALKRFKDSKGPGRDFDENYDIEGELWRLDDFNPLSDALSNDEKRFRLQHAYLNYCRNQGWSGTASEKFMKTGEMPEAKTLTKEALPEESNDLTDQVLDDVSGMDTPDRISEERKSLGASSTGGTKMTPFVMPNDPDLRLNELIRIVGMSGFLSLEQSLMDVGFDSIVREDLEESAEVFEALAEKIRASASKKKRFSIKIFDSPDRPIRKVLDELAA